LSFEIKKVTFSPILFEKKSGGSGWLTQQWKQDLLERASISIAKGNYNMLRDNRTLPAG